MVWGLLWVGIGCVCFLCIVHVITECCWLILFVGVVDLCDCYDVADLVLVGC